MSEKDLDLYADGEKPLVFHYNRTERISRAPQNVRDYYAGKNQMPKGLFKVLVASKFSRIMLLSVALLSIAFVFLSRNAPDSSSGTVAGIPAAVSAFSFDDSVYVSVELKDAATEQYTLLFLKRPVLVSARVDFLDGGGKVIDSAVIEGIYEGKQGFLRTISADYGILEIAVLLNAGDESLALKAKVIHK
jgi:hypothetical protein